MITPGVNHQMPEAERRALSWVVDRIHYFNPLQYGDMLKLDLAVKASAELALLCDYAHSNDTHFGRALYKDIASYLWFEVFCSSAMQDYLLTTEVGLLTFGFYASLRQCGYQDQRYERKLNLLL